MAINRSGRKTRLTYPRYLAEFTQKRSWNIGQRMKENVVEDTPEVPHYPSTSESFHDENGVHTLQIAGPSHDRHGF
jgi:hypothetical protein